MPILYPSAWQAAHPNSCRVPCKLVTVHLPQRLRIQFSGITGTHNCMAVMVSFVLRSRPHYCLRKTRPLGHSKISLLLQCQHPIWMSVQVLAYLLIQLPAKVPKKAVEGGPSPLAPKPTWDTQKKLLAPCFWWPSSRLCGHLGTEPESGNQRWSRSLAHSLSFLLCSLPLT